MADTRYGSRYNRIERNAMWTIAFVILLLVLIVWGVWYFSRPDVGAMGTQTTEAASETTGGEVTPATAADTTTEAPGATQGTAQGEVAEDTGTVY